MGMGAASGATVGADPGPPPPGPLTLNFAWQGSAPFYNAAGASGVTSGFGQWFAHNVTGGRTPYTETETITDNPSGKLGLTGAGGNEAVTWSGMALNEVEYITVKYEVTDAGGEYLAKTDSAVIKRVS
jgi:hypothetical protein